MKKNLKHIPWAYSFLVVGQSSLRGVPHTWKYIVLFYSKNDWSDEKDKNLLTV